MPYQKELKEIINREHFKQKDIYILIKKVNKKYGYISLYEFVGILAEHFSVRLNDKDMDCERYIIVSKFGVSIEVKISDFDFYGFDREKEKSIISYVHKKLINKKASKDIEIDKENGISFHKEFKRPVLLFKDEKIFRDSEKNRYYNEFNVSENFSKKYIIDDRVDTFEKGILIEIENDLIYVTREEAKKYKLDEVVIQYEVVDGDIVKWKRTKLK